MLDRLVLIIFSWFAKLITFIIRLLGKGSGTALPGYVVEKYFPSLLGPLLKNYSNIILITGTNGKTTTRSLLVHIFNENGIEVVSNIGGANIIRGIASSLLQNLDIVGSVKHKTTILEVEEASLPILTTYCKVDTLILTNIFRDQLDAYGEIDTTLGFFTTAITQGQPKTIVANTDDQKLLSSIPRNYHDRIVGFGVTDRTAQIPQFEESLTIKSIYPKDFYHAKKILTSENSSHISIETSGRLIEAAIKLPGIFNIYNALAAICAAFPLFGNSTIPALQSFQPAFGRGEIITIGRSVIHLLLIKNPVGFDQVLQHIQSVNKDKAISLAILINDNTADGRDVSWLWDCDIESFVENQAISSIKTSGTRGLDMLLRLKYAGLKNPKKSMFVESIPQLTKEIVDSETSIYILSTYTALLDIRKNLGEYTKLAGISESGN
jgi:lipid II isoglutaminyl synthase (glutamine-hydrolysing)